MNNAKLGAIPTWAKHSICCALLDLESWPEPHFFFSWGHIFEEIKKPYSELFDHWGTEEIEGEACLVSHKYASSEDEVADKAKKFAQFFGVEVTFDKSEYSDGCVKIIFWQALGLKNFSSRAAALEKFIEFWIQESL